MGQTQPFLYDARREDSRFPTTTFDPKAVTRASWEPKPKKPTPKGPMVSFDLHPDYHVILPHRRDNYSPLDRRTKIYITWLRRFQLTLRILQLIAGIGVLVLFSLFTGVDNTTSWAMRILQAVTIAHTAYAIYHLSRDAGGRTPASSAAYQFSAIFVDTGSVVGYTLGALTVHKNAAAWGIVLGNKDILPVFTLAVFYTTIGAGSTHVLTLFSCAWLGWMFRKITLLPPDMNPLEDNLTARPLHKRNRSSISTANTAYGTDKPWLESRRNSTSVYDGVPERVSVSFMHTRTESRDSGISMGSRAGSSPERKKAPLRYLPRASYPNSYASVPSREPEAMPPRVSETLRNVAAEARRPASGSSQTNQAEQRATNAARSHRSAGSKSYAALSQPYSMGGISSDSESEQDDTLGDILRKKGRLGVTHPKPLTSNPILPRPLNTRRGQIDDGAQYDTVSDEYEEPPSWTSRDIADDRLQPNVQSQRYRDSSIQLDSHFDTRVPGRDENTAGPAALSGSRKVSSGNDYWLSHSAAHERRRVSGKMAEEGRAERGSRSLLSP
ncbi:hypothetical protein ACSS6W_005382 [Trichoderma asperelloides]|uniref:Uncharacterized protein n=1 Tax=Trichoderma asperellum TaxID=101201 RepID=A0A6V8R1S3_TRIAP|nr:hypothetical protein TASIC1_0010000600 [Trichoderma asperellum]